MDALLFLAVFGFISACCCCPALAYEFAGCIYYPVIADANNNSTSALTTTPAAGTVPLSSVSVKADIRGLTVGITAQLKYVNSMDETIETRFVFPLSDEAAVYRLEAVIGGRKLVAEVKRREEAQEIYKKAIEEGKKAILLESQRGTMDVFRLSLGNLPPYEEALVTIGYVQPIDRLVFNDGVLSMTLPMVLNPRYVPHHEMINPKVMDAKFGSQEFISVSDIAYKMTFDASVELGVSRQIVAITSRNSRDRLDVTFNDEKTSAKVSLMNDFTGDHDFQLLIKPSVAFQPMVIVEPGVAKSESAWLSKDIVATWLRPRRKSAADQSDPSDLELWLVVDRSGSMDYGNRIASARSALLLLIKQLPVGCKFNIIGFGNNFATLFPHGVKIFDNSTASVATEHLSGIKADMGGTEILAPLLYIYEEKPVSRQRFILLLTDGEVSNVNEVIALVQKNAATTSVFSIGIGDGASTTLVNGVARVSNGLSAFVRSANDRLEDKVLAMAAAMLAPSLKDVSINWTLSGGSISSLIPKQLEKFYLDMPITQYAVIERKKDQDVTGYSLFTDSGNCSKSCRFNFQISFDTFSGGSDTLALHRLSAKRWLTELVDKFSADKNNETREEAIAVSMATGVLCEYTAMVAVDVDSGQPLKTTRYNPSENVDRKSFSYAGTGAANNLYPTQTVHLVVTMVLFYLNIFYCL